jgi:hypothetical protein
MIKCFVRRAEDTECTAGLSCARRRVWPTLIKPHLCCRDSTDTGAYPLGYPSRRCPYQRLRRTGWITLLALATLCLPRSVRTSASENIIIKAVKREPASRSHDNAGECRLPSNISWSSIGSTWLLKENVFFIQAWIQIGEWFETSTLKTIFLCIVLWREETCFAHKCVFNVHNRHPWMRNNSHAIRERQYQFLRSVKCWAGIVGGVVTCPYMLPDRLSSQWYLNFPETLLSRMLWSVTLSCEA